MKSFLSVLGKIVKVVGVVSGFVPLVGQIAGPGGKPVLDATQDKLDKAVNVIVSVEQAFANIGEAQGSGSKKLAAAVPFVAQIIQQVDLLSGKKPKDEAKFTAAATALTSALADILNSFEG